MKVLFYTPFYLPQSQAAAVRSYWLVKTLKDNNHQVEVLTSIKTPDSKQLKFNPADNKQSFLKRLLFEVIAGCELFIQILCSRHELIILSSPPFITIWLAHLAARLKGTKYILDVRDIYPDVYFAQRLIKEDSVPGTILKRITQSMYAHAHGIVSVTPGLVHKIQTASPKSKVELLINGFDSSLFKPSLEKFEKFTIIFHGNMGKVQNIPTILKVATQLIHHPEIEFVFIGEGPQAELFKGSQLPNVKYLGPKSYQQIPDIISKAHIGFSARRDDEIGSDAFPVKVFEYVGVGIPVIMTPKSGVMTQLIPEGLYEFSNNDIEEMVAKILELKENRSALFNGAQLSRQLVSRKILDFTHFN